MKSNILKEVNEIRQMMGLVNEGLTSTAPLKDFPDGIYKLTEVQKGTEVKGPFLKQEKGVTRIYSNTHKLQKDGSLYGGGKSYSTGGVDSTYNNEAADRPDSLSLNERQMLGGLMNRMGDYFPEWPSTNYGFKRKHTYADTIDTISYTNGSEQLVFKVKDLFDGKFSDVYVAASGDIIGNLMSNYKGKEYPLEKMEELFDEIGRDVLSRYKEIKKDGYNVVSKVDLPNGNYTLSGSGDKGQIMKNGEPTNFYLLLKHRVRGPIEGDVTVSNGMVKGGENYGGILSILRK